jgi:LPXTG-motif cell wall-anchored protein
MPYTKLAFRVALALTLTASPAAAQFTAVVAPPKAREAAPAAVAEATPGARTDSAGRTALGDMRAWVDSAAGIAAPSATAQADTTRRDSTATWTSAAGAVAQAADTTVAADGAMRAPDTATMMPAVALLGLLMLGAGAWLLRRARA